MNAFENAQPDTWEAIEEELHNIVDSALSLQTRIATLAGIPDELNESDIKPDSLRQLFSRVVDAEMDCNEALGFLTEYRQEAGLVTGSL